MKTAKLIALVLLAVAGVVGTAVGILSQTGAAQADAPGVPSAHFIAAALNNQAQASIKVHYQQDYSGKVDGQHHVWTIEYTRTPEVQRLDRTWSSGSTGQQSYDMASGEYRDLDGRVNRAIISVSGRQNDFAAKDFLETALLTVYDRDLPRAILRGTLSPQMEEVDGHGCWRVDIPPPFYTPWASNYTIWLDPEIGFCPRRVQVPRDDGKEPFVASFRNYREISGGIWFPTEYVRTTTDSTLVDRVTDVRYIDAKPAKDSLIVKFPPGTQVSDRERNMTYTAP